MEGWISIYRQIQDNWIWKSKEPFDRRSAWIDLLLMVNHENEKILFDNKIMEIKKGQRVTSLQKLAERWKWSTKKVSNFLNLLEQDQMLKQSRDHKKTLISIENYGKYQVELKEKKHSGNSQETVGKTNNNDNNDNNINIIVKIYNETCINLPKVKKITDKRNKLINTFLKSFSIDEFKTICEIANNNSFLIGKNNRGWKADFDFLINANKATSVLEGKYGDTRKVDYKIDGGLQII